MDWTVPTSSTYSAGPNRKQFEEVKRGQGCTVHIVWCATGGRKLFDWQHQSIQNANRFTMPIWHCDTAKRQFLGLVCTK